VGTALFFNKLPDFLDVIVLLAWHVLDCVTKTFVQR